MSFTLAQLDHQNNHILPFLQQHVVNVLLCMEKLGCHGFIFTLCNFKLCSFFSGMKAETLYFCYWIFTFIFLLSRNCSTASVQSDLSLQEHCVIRTNMGGDKYFTINTDCVFCFLFIPISNCLQVSEEIKQMKHILERESGRCLEHCA